MRLVTVFLALIASTISLSSDVIGDEVELAHALIAEKTGKEVRLSPLPEGCQFSEPWQLWLCQPQASDPARTPDPAAYQRAVEAIRSSSGALLIPNSSTRRLMVFDSHTGDLIDDRFIELDPDSGTVIHAILRPQGDILISDQLRNVVHRYTPQGDYLGPFAPIGGPNTTIMQNIRGMSLRPNGNLLVTVAGNANANSIVEFGPDGTYLGTFITPGSGGLNSPFDIYLREGTDWLVSSINTNQVLRYDVVDELPLGEFATISSFPQQIVQTESGNVLVANFSGTAGVHEFAADGSPIGVYSPKEVGGNRGVYPLGNGNILTSSGSGVFEINREGELVEVKYEGASRFIQWASLYDRLELDVTVGLVPDECGVEREIAILANTEVTFCYTVTNNTDGQLTQHDLEDSEFGTILDGFAFGLDSGESTSVTESAFVFESRLAVAEWTAYNIGPLDINQAIAAARVNVEPASVRLRKTVGLEQNVCASDSFLVVDPGTTVTFCFQIENTGPGTLTRHDLEDDLLGVILDTEELDLAAGESLFITRSATINEETWASATWTAYNPGPNDIATSSSSALVVFSEDIFADRFEDE